VGNRKLVAAMVVLVLVIWLGGAALTKYSLEQMALFAPLAVCVVGATAGVVLLWVKIVLQARRERRERRTAGPGAGLKSDTS
jgi:uncharacterized membrane protein